MKVCIVTGTRAEYGLFYWLLKAFEADPFFELQLVVTGMHLSTEFGSTYQEIEQDGFVIHDKVEVLLSGDTPTAITKSTALALIGLADSFQRLQPDLVLLLGDRFEALGAAQAALFANIPIVHLHGGEVTLGAMDESIRHAISKMAHIHFPATDTYRRRLIQMGESPEYVHNVGALGVESLNKTRLMSRPALMESLSFDLGEQFFLVTYHPVTRDLNEQQDGMTSLLNALERFPEIKVLITFPNADTYGRQLITQVQVYAKQNAGRVYLTESLGRVRYLSALRQCCCVIGNSSSGIIEAPSFNVATVDIGSRQQGRVKADSVIQCEPNQVDIEKAIQKAMQMKTSGELSTVKNPYNGGNTSEKIVSVLKRMPLSDFKKKHFYDLP